MPDKLSSAAGTAVFVAANFPQQHTHEANAKAVVSCICAQDTQLRKCLAMYLCLYAELLDADTKASLTAHAHVYAHYMQCSQLTRCTAP